MSDWNGFGSLDLSDVEESTGSMLLSEGEHTVKCTEAAMEDFGGNNKRLRCKFESVNGAGSLGHSFNVVHTTSKQAQEIGRRMLKTFLSVSGHPTPDKPGDVASLKGLTAQVYIGMGKPYMKDGVEKQYPEIKSFSADPSSTADKGGKDDTSGEKDLDDEIPF